MAAHQLVTALKRRLQYLAYLVGSGGRQLGHAASGRCDGSRGSQIL